MALTLLYDPAIAPTGRALQVARGNDGGEMGYRMFRDSQGTEWQAWDVVPRLGERRSSERRGRVTVPVPVDRRSSRDRRITATQRPLLTSGLDGGWLCFETDEEKRRLAPIPADWQRCPESQLEDYCRLARPARRASVEISGFKPIV